MCVCTRRLCKLALILLGNHALWTVPLLKTQELPRLSIRGSISSSRTYVVLRVGWYSNKAEGNSIHWAEESVRRRRRRRSGRVVAAGAAAEADVEVGENPNSDKLIRLTLCFLPSFLPPAKRKQKSHFSLFPFFQGHSTRAPPPPFLLLLLPPDRISCT